MESSWRLQQSAELILRTSNGQMPWTWRPKKLLPTPFVIEYIEGRCGLSTYIYRITDKYSTYYHYTWTSLFCTLSQLRMGTTSHSRAVTTDKIQRSLSRHTCSRPSRLLPAWFGGINVPPQRQQFPLADLAPAIVFHARHTKRPRPCHRSPQMAFLICLLRLGGK